MATKNPQEDVAKMLEEYAKFSTEFAEMSDIERINKIEREMPMKLQQSNLSKKAKQMMINEQNERKRIVDESQKELQVKILMSRMAGAKSMKLITDDGDQSNATGDFGSRLKLMWSWKMDWDPNDHFFSPWMRHLAYGNYNEMMRIIDATHSDDLKDLLERRESLLNNSALFHVVYGAHMLTYAEHVFKYKSPRHMDCFMKLVDLGANIHARDVAGFTPLFLCVTKQSNPVTIRMAQILLDKGADPNAKNRLGENTLSQPVMSRKLDCVELLLKHGANSTNRDNHGCCVETMYPFDKDLKALFAKARKNKGKNMRMEEKKKADGSYKCPECGKVATRRCTGCYLTKYCSAECQKGNWKKHKKICKQIKSEYKLVNLITTKTDGESLTVDISWIDGKVTAVDQEIPISKDNFVVKIQTSIVDTCTEIRAKFLNKSEKNVLTLYNENKSVYGRITEDDPTYTGFVEKIKNEGVYGEKGYFFAIIDKDGNLRINVEKILPPRSW